MFYGQGMRPDLTGKGLGPGFIKAAFEFGIEKFDYRREYVYLDVLTFNKRAYRAYEKAGFEFDREYSLEDEGKIYEFIRMKRKNPRYEK
jgi:ribosomal-protein-alanine N-acetyltransferase